MDGGVGGERLGLKLITPPTGYPVSNTEAKLHLRVSGTAEDALITALCNAATDYCEGRQNRRYLTQTWELYLDRFPLENYIKLPYPPLQKIDSITYYRADGTSDTFTDYIEDTTSFIGRIVLDYGKNWPSDILIPTNGVVIRFTCGYGLAAAVPQKIKQAMLLLINTWYENRGATAEREHKPIPFAVDALLSLDGVESV